MNNIFGKQNFFTGCNYWASHAGTDMWHNWSPETVKEDFKKMKALNLKIVRVFPLWPDFQPLTLHAKNNNTPYQLRWKNNEPIPYDADGRQSGLDPEMLNRFRFVCDCAQENGIKLGIGLITGWMSGKIFAPPAFEQKNLLRDPLVMRWQMKFIKRFVGEFKDHPAISFWGVGNECNCLDSTTREEGALWTRAMSEAIRAADPEKPIVAGLHGITPQPATSLFPSNFWSIADMAEDFDVLTVHPYPLFSPHTSVDRLTGIKAAMHATAEAHFFGDIGKRPCVAEELGTLAPTIAGEKNAAEYLRTTLLQLWAHDCEGLFWWCTFDQLHLEHPPYEWCGVERMLGLYRADGSRKPVANVLANFAEMQNALPFDRLPSFKKEAVCVLTEEQDCWMAAYGAWVLAKQAGFDLEFQYADEPLRDSGFYLVPMISGLNNMPRSRYMELMEKVNQGATLLCTFDGACLAPFDTFFGVTSEYQENYNGTAEAEVSGITLSFDFSTKITLSSCGAEILLSDAENKPMLTKNQYGKGNVFFLTYSPERAIVKWNRAVEKPYYELYKRCFADILSSREIQSGNPDVTVTIHPVDDSTCYAVLINNGESAAECSGVILNAGWQISRILQGNYPEIPSHNAAILELKRKR
ncbi:MAG: cellulase family glycosylhydrolase [Lentisphaeria bacterium]|nr:cellulase family glycosylhydrolase [Lentisphaeria bacterium]